MNRLLGAVCCLLLLASPALAADDDCSDFTKTMIGKVLAVFHDTTTSEPQKRAALDQLFEQGVDTDWIGKYVLGRYWRDATPEQQASYLKLYRSYITNNYISKFNDEDGFSVDSITVTSVAPAAAGGFEAKTIITRKGEDDIHVDYLLDNTGGICHAHDIKVEGVSLLVSQRSEFSAVAANGGIASVIAALEKKTRQ